MTLPNPPSPTAEPPVLTAAATALEGIRVLDLTRVLAGPWAGQNLADLGAEVIKIERPGVGDSTRAFGPFFADADGAPVVSAFFTSANRGKKSLTLDIAAPAGQALLRRLAAHADVLIENYKVGDLQRYGLHYEALRAINPRLVYCSITGFGQYGPYAKRAAYDLVLQGMSGFMSINGSAEESAGSEPVRAGVAISDLFTGQYATSAILAALHYRHTSGEGQFIDLALLDAQIAMLANIAQNHLTSGEVPRRHGNAHATIVPNQMFACADGYLNIVAGSTGGQFEKLCRVLGCEALAGDPRFVNNAGRNKNRKVLLPLLTERLMTRPAAEWVAALEAVGVPCGPVNDIGQAFADPQVAERGIKTFVDHPVAGRIPVIANPMRLSATPPRHRPPPMLGQHNRDVLCGVLGLSDAEYETLRAQAVI